MRDSPMSVMSQDEILRAKLAAMLDEHRRLNDQVDRMGREIVAPSIELQRLKKKKLMLRDEIAALQDRITPDIIA